MTTTREIMTVQIAAAQRLERAEWELSVATVHQDTLVLDAPLRFKVEADERYRRALAARDAARLAFDAVQDIDCPEDWD